MTIACAVAASAGAARAQSAAPRFRHVGVDDGLPTSLVTSIAQDRRGFLWVATAHGVSRYDGSRFRTWDHRPGDLRGIPVDHVDRIYIDRRDVPWAVTTRGVSRYDATTDRFVTYMRAPAVAGGGRAAGGHAAGGRAGGADAAARMITSVTDDARGRVWVGTSVGLFRLDPRTGRETRVLAALPNGHVTALHTDRRGRVWVGTVSGLFRLDDGDAVAARWLPDARTGMPDATIQTFAEDSAGTVWAGTTGGGLLRVDGATDALRVFRHVAADPASLGRDRVRSLAVDRRGGVWVGTENAGLDYYDAATDRFTHHRFDPNTTTSIGSNSVWALHLDAAGALWVGTFSGGLDVSPLTPPAIDHFRAIPGDPTSLSYNAVPRFAESRDGTIWVATDGGGLNRFDPRTGRFTRYTQQTTNLNNGAVVGVLEDRRGAVWVGTWGGGLSALDPRTGHFTAYTRHTADLPNDNLLEVYEDRAGRLWLGTDSATVALFDRASGRVTRTYHVEGPVGDPGFPVGLIRELADGRLAIGLHSGGVTILDPRTGAQEHWVPAAEDGSPPPAGARGTIAGTDVRSLLEIAPGVLWLGTNNGLDRVDLRTGRVQHVGEADGLPSRVVDGVLADDRGRLWASTDRGLVRLDPVTRAVRVFTRGDGLQGSEFLRGAVLRSRDGTLYFGGNHGFNVVCPAHIMEDLRPPPVVFTGLQLFNRPVAVGAPRSPLRRAIDRTDTLVLDHAQNVVTFEFAALDYLAPGKNRYAYRLDGFDRDWQDVGTQNSASYTNLAPGTYTLRVKGSNGDGVWNERGARLTVVVTPPVWQTWWFRALAGAAAAAAAFALLRFQQRRRLEVELSRRALHDPLTGLANRALFRDRVEHALAGLSRLAHGHEGDARRVAVLFLDLDGFKAVNDAMGHHAGDRVLLGVAARLLNATRGCDTVARFGGDEFAVLLENARGPADAVTVAERIVSALRTPIAFSAGGAEREARVGASVGLAFAEPGVDADTLLRQADAAMYQAKSEGKGRQAVFHPALVAAADERLALETDLAGALERGEFTLAYQPIVSLDGGAVVGAEALLRWHNPARGPVSPARFIPLAEASGLIVPLGRWVLEEACRAAASWEAPAYAGAGPVGVTVNVSGRQLDDPALPGYVTDALAASGLPAARLTLEITESALMRDTDGALRSLGALKALGVRLAIDDFGTGYSSLRYLQQFPVDVLKIDKSFVDGVARGGHDAALVRTIVSLAEMLSLRAVAEGIEHAAQCEALRAMGCELGQGYLFARPVDGDTLRARLAAWVPVEAALAAD